MEEPKLTLIERLILANQYRILRLVDTEESKWYEQAEEIVRNGYEYEYSVLTEPLLDPVPLEDCKEVYDILDMFRALDIAHRDMPDLGVDWDQLRFQGFDGNHEINYYTYIDFLMNWQDKWAESKIPYLNSHREMLPRYRAMWRQWQTSENIWKLTEDDILRILAAASGY